MNQQSQGILGKRKNLHSHKLNEYCIQYCASIRILLEISSVWGDGGWKGTWDSIEYLSIAGNNSELITIIGGNELKVYLGEFQFSISLISPSIANLQTGTSREPLSSNLVEAVQFQCQLQEVELKLDLPLMDLYLGSTDNLTTDKVTAPSGPFSGGFIFMSCFICANYQHFIHFPAEPKSQWKVARDQKSQNIAGFRWRQGFKRDS